MPLVAAGIEDDRRIAAAPLHLVVPGAGSAQVQEILPADHGSVRRDLFDLAALRQHIARADGTAQLVLHAGDDDVHHLGILADGLEFIVKLIQRDDAEAFGFIQVEFDFLLRGERMDHVADAAHQVHRIEHENGLGTVGHGDGDPVSLPDAQGLEAFGAGLHLLHQLAVGGGPAHKIEGHVIGIFLCNLLHRIEHGALRIFQMHGHAAHMLLPRGLGSDFHRLLLSFAGSSARARSADPRGTVCPLPPLYPIPAGLCSPIFPLRGTPGPPEA